ncbi:hypothetical protein, partial [Microvirga lenta]|uniref:hypothetical protein n=1 Tax=Microvirga lenta TaxID=2881337 RepID=UPI001CFFEAD2
AAFLVRLPVTSTTGETPLGQWSKQIFGSSPLAFGIGKINVFNSNDLSLFLRQQTVFNGSAFHPLSAKSPSPTALELRLPILSDVHRYSMIAQRRRMARSNIGCDRSYYEMIVGLMSQAARQSGLPADGHDIIVENSLLELPSAAQLNAHEFVEMRMTALCRGVIDTAAGELKDLAFVQIGVDRALKAKGYKPILSAKAVEAALSYPCRVDGGFLNTMIDANRALSA